MRSQSKEALAQVLSSDDDSGVPQNLRNPSRLGGVLYRVAETAEDYKKCHTLATAEAVRWSTFTFPTIMALRDGKLIGFVSTKIQNDMIILGPLVLDSKGHHPFIALRLIEAYDIVMKGLGIEWYIFHTPSEGPLAAYAEKLGMERYSEKDGQAFFLRELTDGTS